MSCCCERQIIDGKIVCRNMCRDCQCTVEADIKITHWSPAVLDLVEEQCKQNKRDDKKP